MAHPLDSNERAQGGDDLPVVSLLLLFFLLLHHHHHHHHHHHFLLFLFLFLLLILFWFQSEHELPDYYLAIHALALILSLGRRFRDVYLPSLN